MIHTALNGLKEELKAYILSSVGSSADPDIVKLSNVALIESSDHASDLLNSIIISLVNIEEESTLKNGLHFKKDATTGMVRYENPPVHLNLYLLFSCNFPDKDKYLDALQYLSLIIQFVQGKNHFIIAAGDTNFDLILDMYTMTFEQINHLWGSLGGKQVPFVMYKARLVRITDRRATGGGKLIEEVQGIENIN
jgi:hypothetical protein